MAEITAAQQEELCLDPKTLVSVSTFALMCGVARPRVYEAIRDGRIIPVTLGPNNEYTFIDTAKYSQIPDKW